MLNSIMCEMFTNHVTLILLLLYAVTSQEVPSNTNQVCLIVPPDVEECYRQFQGKPISDKAAKVNCLQKLLWNYTPETNLTTADFELFRQLAGDLTGTVPGSRAGQDIKNLQPPTGRRARKEYRLLTDRERQNFHAALQKLYEDGTIQAFAMLYSNAFTSHYSGASFLPWQRIYLLMFEEALRRHDASISLPYWDSTIDHDMDNPVNSVLWMPEYFGNGVGSVTSGFAASWVTSQGNLERNYGQISRLLSKTQIRRILSKCYLQDISKPTAEKDNDLENISSGPLKWVGGDMSSPSTAGYDPIFYLHLAFVDYIWEHFRLRQQRVCGVDPATDYPMTPDGNSHAPETVMAGFNWLRNIDGIQQHWIENWYYYQLAPSCPDCCLGCRFPAPVYCDNRKGTCVARSRRVVAFGRRNALNSSATATAHIFHLDPDEKETLEITFPPRNRGEEFDAPPNDGRTLRTAISDALASYSQPDNSHPRSEFPADDRGRATGISNSFSERRNSFTDRGSSDERSNPSSHRILSSDLRGNDPILRSDDKVADIQFNSNDLPQARVIPEQIQTERRISPERRVMSNGPVITDGPFRNPLGRQEPRFMSDIPQLDTPTSLRRDNSASRTLTDTRQIPRRVGSGRPTIDFPERRNVPNRLPSNSQLVSGRRTLDRRTIADRNGEMDRRSI